MSKILSNLCEDSTELTEDVVREAYQEFPVKEETPEMRMFRMKGALKWNTVLLNALLQTGILTKECKEQIAENESLTL